MMHNIEITKERTDVCILCVAINNAEDMFMNWYSKQSKIMK